MRITVLGGTGYAGAAILAEAANRGHTVRSYSRHAPETSVDGVEYVLGSLTESALLSAAVQDADVVIETLSPRGDMQGRVEGVVNELIELAASAGVRLGVIGGVSSVLVAEGGPRLFDVSEPPPEVLPEIQTGLALLELLRESRDSVDWFYVSPAANFGSWLPQRVEGRYRVSDDVLLKDENGESYIAAPDLALAVLDEIEQPKYRRRRLHVAL